MGIQLRGPAPGKTKFCIKCKQQKFLKNFHKCKSGKDGLQSYCKKCKSVWKTSLTGKESGRKSRTTLKSYLHQVFRDITHRCNSPKYHAYHRYGGRGIKCLFKSSDEFVDYVISKLKINPRGLTIDRINNDGDYKPENIRFVTHKENCNNKGKHGYKIQRTRT